MAQIPRGTTTLPMLSLPRVATTTDLQSRPIPLTGPLALFVEMELCGKFDCRASLILAGVGAITGMEILAIL